MAELKHTCANCCGVCGWVGEAGCCPNCNGDRGLSRTACLACDVSTVRGVFTRMDWPAEPALDRIEAALAEPTLYEAHGHIVTGPPRSAVGTGCLLCDMIQTVGPHDPECALAAAIQPVQIDLKLVAAEELIAAIREDLDWADRQTDKPFSTNDQIVGGLVARITKRLGGDRG